jgi:hypothetical protein
MGNDFTFYSYPTVKRGGCEESSSAVENKDPKPCGESVCPKCEAMHAKHVAGKAELVSGLMKACYLALGEGRYDKAVDLARQAYAVDPARVEADPLVYKMHLLGEPCQMKKCGKEMTECVPPLPAVNAGVVEALDAVLTGADGLGKPSKPQK